MPLHPLLQSLLDAAATQPPPPDIATARQLLREMVAKLPRSPLTLAEQADLEIPLAGRTLRARRYRPAAERQAGTPPPLVVFFHGGGWCLCDLDTHDTQCRRLAHESGAVVVSVEYRLAPEHPFPAGHEDCLQASTWLREHAADWGVDGARWFLCGDSAGGNLAAGVAHALRDAGAPPACGQVLVYPALQHISTPTPSYARLGSGWGLNLETAHIYWRQVLPHPQAGIPLAMAPLRDSRFDGLPPTLVIVGEYDMLRDECADYVQRLRAAGVDAELRDVDGVNHAFMAFEALLPQADAEWRHIGAWMRQRA